MKQFGLDERSWFQMAQNRDQWRAACKEGVRNALKWGRKRIVNEDRTSLSHLIHLLKLHIHWSVRLASRPSKGNKT